MAVAAPPLLPTSVPSTAPAPAPNVATAIASAGMDATRAFLSCLLDSAKRSLSGPAPGRSSSWHSPSRSTTSPTPSPSLPSWCLLYILRPADEPRLAVCSRTFSDRETLGGLVAASAFVVFLTSVGGIIFSELALGTGVVCTHGASRVPEDLFLYLLIMRGFLGISCMQRAINGVCRLVLSGVWIAPEDVTEMAWEGITGVVDAARSWKQQNTD